MKECKDFYKGKRVLITGHTGFKGSWLSIWLHHMGADVIGYALNPPTQPNLFETYGLSGIITSVYGDIRNHKNLRNVFNDYQPQIVFHMAAQPLVRLSYREPFDTYETNVMGTVSLFEACRHTSSVRAVINITSDKCYENREWIWGYRENEPVGGDDPYSSSKGCAELITNAYIKSYFNPGAYKEHGKGLASVRAGNVIGGGDWAEDRLIPDCVKVFVANKPLIIRYPNAVRPWQHVLDPLYGYMLLGQNLYENGPEFMGAWNFGPDDNDAKPVEWIVKYAAEIWGDNSGWLVDQGDFPHEANYLQLDCSKAKAKLRWYQQWDVRLALKKTIEWYKAFFNKEDMRDFTISQIKEFEIGLSNRKT